MKTKRTMADAIASGYLTVTETATLVRGALKQKFPGVKFSVRSDSYANGASIRVRWTDGPTEDEVKQVVYLYEGASFDGMIDLKSYHDTILVDENGEPHTVHMGADYIFADRDYSPEMEAQVLATYKRIHGRDYDPNERVGNGWGSDALHRVRRVSKFGVEPHDDDAFYGRVGFGRSLDAA